MEPMERLASYDETWSLNRLSLYKLVVGAAFESAILAYETSIIPH